MLVSGTEAPVGTLDVRSTNAVGSVFRKDFNGPVADTFSKVAVTLWGQDHDDADVGTGTDQYGPMLGFGARIDDGNPNSGDVRAGISYSYNGDLTFHAKAGASVADGSYERIRIDGVTGNVGIGETNPIAKLHIDSSVDDVRIINRRSGTQGAQIDMLGFSSSPADGDNVAEINMGGYYVGTSSAYFGSIRMNAPNRGGRHGRMDFYTRKDSAFTTKMSIDEDGKIFTYDNTFGSQLYADSNAASDPQGNESNATTGWSAGYTGSSLSSVGTDNGVSPSVGSYQLKYTGTNNGARQDYLIPSNLVAGKRYEVTINARWYQGSLYTLAYVASSNSGDNLGYAISPTLALNNSSYTETKFDFVSTHTGIAYLSLRMASTSSPTNITYIDNISIKEINGSEVHAKDQNLGGDLTVAGETTLGGVVKKSLVIASTENPIYSAADADKYFTYTPEADLGYLTWDFTTDERIKFHARSGYGTSGYIRVGRGLDAHVLPEGWTGTVSAYMYGWSGNFATTVRMETKPLSSGTWTTRFSTDDNGSAEYAATGSWTVTTPLTEPYAVRFYLAQSSGVGTSSDRCYVKDITITNLVDDYNNISQEIVHHNGNVTINDGNLVLANGHGIDFSATSNGSGTTTSELLDDYEEGTWTPTITGYAQATPHSQTYSTQTGNYTKVGNLVTAHFVVTLSNKGNIASASGNYSFITGLPFTHGGSVAGTGVMWGWQALNTAVSMVAADISSTNTLAWLTHLPATSGAGTSYMGTSQITNTTSFRGTLIYKSS